MPQENNGSPIIPAGTTTQGGLAYDPLKAAIAANNGQAQPAPQSTVPQQVPAPNAPMQGTTFAELAQKKGWKTPDDMATSYANLESHNKKVEMTADDVLKMVQAASQQSTPQPVQPVVQQPMPRTPDEQAIQIVQSLIRTEVKPLQERVALQDLFIKNPDAKDYAQGIADVVKSNPGISWENAYKLAKFDAVAQKASQQGRQEAYQTIQQKQEFIAGSSVPAQRSGPDVRSIIKDRSVPFAEVDKMVREALTAQGL